MLVRPSVLLLAAVVGCSEAAPVLPPPPPPPQASLDGTWLFDIRVTRVPPNSPPICATWLGKRYQPTITISQAGNTVIAQGFLDLLENELSGTIDAARRVSLAGSYHEGGGVMQVTHTLTWDGGTALAGGGTWIWTDGIVTCSHGDFSVGATRM